MRPLHREDYVISIWPNAFYWWATVWLAPERNLGLFAVTNVGGDPAFAATVEAVETLIRRLDAAASSRWQSTHLRRCRSDLRRTPSDVESE